MSFGCLTRINPGVFFYGGDGRMTQNSRGRLSPHALLQRRLFGALATGPPERRLALVLEIERHGSSDESLQSFLIDLVTFVDVDGAPDIPVEARVE